MLGDSIRIAASNMFVSSAKGTISKQSVNTEKMGKVQMLEWWKVVMQNPKYQRGFIWNAEVGDLPHL